MGGSCPKALIQGGIIEGKCLGGGAGQKSRWQLPRGDFLMEEGGNCLGSNCPGGIYSGLIVLGGNCPWGNFIGGNSLGGE